MIGPLAGTGGPCCDLCSAPVAADMPGGGRPPGLGVRRTHRRRVLRYRARALLLARVAVLEQEAAIEQAHPAQLCKPLSKERCVDGTGESCCSASGPAPKDEAGVSESRSPWRVNDFSEGCRGAVLLRGSGVREVRVFGAS